MKAMVLAAGLGTRLRPLTNDKPKALVEVAGRTMLQITLERLRDFGINDVIINVHHFADKVIDYLKDRQNFGMRVAISREDVLLDTGGGLKRAAWFFSGDAEPFILHNVDVISTVDFQRMLDFHQENQALATLTVKERPTSRPFVFDEQSQLCGHGTHLIRLVAMTQLLGFSGIHVISPQLLGKITEDGVFSIIPTYLRLAEAGEKIMAFRADEYYWRDLGKPESIAQAEEDLRCRGGL